MALKHKNLQEALTETARLVQDKISDLLPEVANCGEKRVIEAMRYSALAGGKKLRPFLVVTTAALFGVGLEASLQAASAIELVHVYSLVHDDLPAMDNDDMRRGQPSCHVKFGEAAAILAGDGLLTLAFQILSEPSTHSDATVRSELIRNLAIASGYQGMVGGQMMDLDTDHKTLSIDEIIHLQRMKTGALFGISCEAGAILGKAAAKPRMALRGYAQAIGLAFQITDDLLDAEGIFDETGKPIRQDKSSGKATLVAALGIEKARVQARMLASQARSHLEVFDERAELLRQLADFVIERKM